MGGAKRYPSSVDPDEKAMGYRLRLHPSYELIITIEPSFVGKSMQRDPELHQLITLIARKHGLRVVCDTHYDAFNWEIRWWADGVLHAVDIQPYPEGWIDVFRVRTDFPMLPRLLAWARRIVPMFPRWGHTTREPLARLAWPSEAARLRELIAVELPGNG